MTKQADFKRHVRERMAKTGESYTAARVQLLTQAGAGKSRDNAVPVVEVGGYDAASGTYELIVFRTAP